MDKKQRDMLEAPFPKSEIRQRKGAFGTVNYVDGATVVKRLNEAFDGDWSFEIIEHKFLDGEVLVLGKLTAGGVTKMAFGGSAITRAKKTGEIVSLVDDAKASCMDSLKKSASWFGVFLAQGYTNNHRAESARRTTQKGSTPRRTQPRPGNGGNGRQRENSGNGNNPARITQKQLSCLHSISRRLQTSAEDFRERSLELWGEIPERLSKAHASQWISELNDELGGAAVH